MVTQQCMGDQVASPTRSYCVLDCHPPCSCLPYITCSRPPSTSHPTSGTARALMNGLMEDIPTVPAVCCRVQLQLRRRSPHFVAKFNDELAHAACTPCNCKASADPGATISRTIQLQRLYRWVAAAVNGVCLPAPHVTAHRTSGGGSACWLSVTAVLRRHQKQY